MNTSNIKKLIAREGLILLCVATLSFLSFFIANEILWQEHVIFNYKCTYKGETLTIGIVSASGPYHRLKNGLWSNFIKKSSQSFDAQEKQWADINIFEERYGGCPQNFIVENLSREYTKYAFLQRVFLNFGICLIVVYLLYCLIRYYLWAKRAKKNIETHRTSLILINEGIVIVQSICIWSILLLLEFISSTPPLTFPTQDSIIIKTVSEGLILLPIIYIFVQVVRFIGWAIKTLKDK